MAQLLNRYGNGVVATQVVPPFHLGGTNYPAVAEYLPAIQKYSPQMLPDFGSLEGFLATRVFAEVLRRTGKDLDIQGGNRISIAKDNHQGSQTVYPTVIRGGWFVPVEDWKTVRPQ